MHRKKNQVVGTTLIAALKNNRKAASAETMKNYVNIAKQRILQLKKGTLPIRKMFTSISVGSINSKVKNRK